MARRTVANRQPLPYWPLADGTGVLSAVFLGGTDDAQWLRSMLTTLSHELNTHV